MEHYFPRVAKALFIKYIRETDSQTIDKQTEIICNSITMGSTGSVQTDTDRDTLEFEINRDTQISGLISSRLNNHLPVFTSTPILHHQDAHYDNTEVCLFTEMSKIRPSRV